jgi:putrescine transport system ATP-binding protein
VSTVKPPDKLQTGDGSLPFLQIKRITKQYDDVFAVDDVSLSIEKGEIFALLGSSGCGKSTLLRMLAGFEVPTSGQIVLEGRDIVGLAPYERPINMMFQSYALFPHLTVWDNVAFGLRRRISCLAVSSSG